MKRSAVFLSFIIATLVLGGCIISKSPSSGSVTMTAGDQKTFSIKVFPFNATYTWTLDEAVLSNTDKSYEYTAVSGTHTLKVEAVTSSGTDAQTWTIDVNSSPVAIATANSSIVMFGGKIILDGASSYDPDGTDLTYAWTITTKPSSSTASLSDAAAESPTFIPDKEGRYVFSLVVSDGDLSSIASKVTVDTFTGGFESGIVEPWTMTLVENSDYTFSSDYVHGGYLSFKPECEPGYDNNNKLILSLPFPKSTYVYSISAWMYRVGDSSSAVHSELYVDDTLLLNGNPEPRDPHWIDGKYHILDPKDPGIWVQRTWEVNTWVSTIYFVYNDLYLIDNIYLDDVEINTWGN